MSAPRDDNDSAGNDCAGARAVVAAVEDLHGRLDLHTWRIVPADTLRLNDIGQVRALGAGSRPR